MSQRLLRYDKLRIAFQACGRSADGNRPGTRARWNSGCDVGIGFDAKRSWYTVECDAGGPGQAVAENRDASANLSGNRTVFTSEVRLLEKL